MPTRVTFSITYSRKFQLRKDDWYGFEVSQTLAISEAEADQVDPVEVFAQAFNEAKAAILAQRDQARCELQAELAQAQEQARQAKQQRASFAPSVQPETEPAPPAPPTTPEEAEQRFFARYSEIIGGEQWADVTRYLGMRFTKPTTIEEWKTAARNVRDQAQAQEQQTTIQI